MLTGIWSDINLTSYSFTLLLIILSFALFWLPTVYYKSFLKLNPEHEYAALQTHPAINRVFLYVPDSPVRWGATVRSWRCCVLRTNRAGPAGWPPSDSSKYVLSLLTWCTHPGPPVRVWKLDLTPPPLSAVVHTVRHRPVSELQRPPAEEDQPFTFHSACGEDLLCDITCLRRGSNAPTQPRPIQIDPLISWWRTGNQFTRWPRCASPLFLGGNMQPCAPSVFHLASEGFC